jgi:hypothetical protein
METSKPSTGETLFDLTLYAADTLANPLAPQASVKASKTQDTYGLGLETPLANYDPDTQSWKMYGDTYLWGDSPLLENLPVSGMTRNGVLFPQPVWVPITDETELLSWPTPRNCTAMAATIIPESAHNPKRFPNLETIVGRRTWPTPCSNDANNSTFPESQRKKDYLIGVLMREMWPTPVASDAWTHSLQSSQQTEGSRHSLNLPSAAGGQLNPTWVEWLMGFPTGWTDLED